MSQFENELNKIASEIISFDENFTLPKTKLEQLLLGKKVLEHESLKYCFERFFSLAIKENLTKEALDLYETLSLTTSELSKFTQDIEQLPQEVQEFLNKE